MGYSKTASLLTRGIIENVLRHIYFTDHLIEFGRMNKGPKWYLSMEDLFSYAKNHPDFERTEPRFDAIAKLATLYGDLSASVHGRAVKDLETRIALGRIKYEDDIGTKHVDAVKKCAEAVNFLLAIFHREKVHKFQAEDKRIILRSMPTPARAIWKQFDD